MSLSKYEPFEACPERGPLGSDVEGHERISLSSHFDKLSANGERTLCSCYFLTTPKWFKQAPAMPCTIVMAKSVRQGFTEQKAEPD